MTLMTENSVKKGKREKKRSAWFLAAPYIHLFLLSTGK